MNTVLMVVYYFPPLGSVQVLRALKFAKYLPQYGWKPVVLAVKDVSHYYKDPDLLNELSPEVTVIRTGSLDPFRLLTKFTGKSSQNSGKQSKSDKFQLFRKQFSLLNRWLSLPDSRFGWYPFAVSAGLKAIKENKVDVIYSSSPPNIDHLVALKLHLKSGLPWIADFKDIWKDYPNIPPTKWHNDKMVRWEEKIVAQAARIIAINPAITKDFQKRHRNIPSNQFQTIVHGYDPEEFSGLTYHPHQRFTITHTGSFYEPRQIPDFFFQALQKLIIENPGLVNKIEVRLVGALNERHRQMIEDLNLSSIVRVIGAVSRKEAIKYQMETDLLLLLVGDGIHSDLILPAKTWEYLATGRSILCIAPEGITKDIIQKHEAGIVVSPKDVPGIQRVMEHFYKEFEMKKQKPDDPLSFPEYDRKQLTGNLAQILNELTTSKNVKQI